MNVFILVHRFKQGDELEVFAKRKAAKSRFSELMREYAAEYDVSETADNDSELYEASGGDIALAIEKRKVQL